MISDLGKDVLVRFKDVTKIFSGTIALRKVHISIKKGEVHGIIGKNGAGKTTLVGIMSGIISPTQGEIYINDKKYRTLTRIRARKEGITIVTQEPQIIPEWTVAENLFIPDFICTCSNQLIKWKNLFLKAEEILNKHNIRIQARDKVGDLTVSQQQLLLVLKASYVEDAKVIILDEVSAALSKIDEDNLYDIVEEQKKKGKAIVLISHRMDEILKICDRVTVIRDGQIVAVEELANLDHYKLSAFIVGEGGKKFVKKEEKKLMESTDTVGQEEILSVHEITQPGLFRKINFSVKKGEVVGLAGLRGSGRTEIFKAIVGIDPAPGGWITLAGENKRFTSPAQALKEGMVYLPEDRDGEGLIDILSVKENLSLSCLAELSSKGLINRKEEDSQTEKLIELLHIQTPSAEEEVNKLSGGNRQKVMLGKILATKPIVYLLDEPTKGIDIAAKKDLLKIIEEELIKSAGVILTSPGLEELMLICDRILILYKGQITGEFSREEFREADLYLAMQGMGKEEIIE